MYSKITKQNIYDYLIETINLQKEFGSPKYETLKQLYNDINNNFDLNLSHKTWQKRREREIKFYNLTSQIMQLDNNYITTIGEFDNVIVNENAFVKFNKVNNNDRVVKFSGHTFEELNDADIIEKVKQSYKRTAKKFQLNYLEINYDGDICIVALGDTHIGKGLNIDKLLADLEIIANTPNMYVILMGDYADNFVNGAWCMNMALIESITPREQNKLTDSIIGKIAHKIIGVLTGNHNDWSTVGDYNPLYTILEKYGYKGFYGTNRLDIELMHNGIKHIIRVMHNWPGRSITSPTYGIEKSCKIDSFDIGIAAHTHEGAMYREFMHENKKRLAIKVGSYKVDEYAYNLGYTHNGMLNDEAAVPIIITRNGNYSNVASLEHAAKLLKG